MCKRDGILNASTLGFLHFDETITVQTRAEGFIWMKITHRTPDKMTHIHIMTCGQP